MLRIRLEIATDSEQIRVDVKDEAESPQAPESVDSDEDVAEMEISDMFDLQWFRLEDVPEVVSDYLEAAVEKGFAEVRLIHGKRTGTRRLHVHAALSKHPLVLRFADAPRMRGGWGGTLVWLQKA